MIRKLVLPFILALGFQAVLMVLLRQPSLSEAPQGPAGDTLCVNPGGTGSCYAKIQDAIDDATAGDVITVAAGTYTEHITMTEGVSIYGQGWASTIIDGGYSMDRATVHIPPGVSASTVLSGVQITGGGTGTTTTSHDGGGIRVSYASPSIVNTWVNSCTAKFGGGVFVNAGSPTFDNVPVWNSRAQRGGGFYLQGGGKVTILGNPLAGLTNGTVLWNSANEGGGIYIASVTTTLAGLRIWWNTASVPPSPCGGGVYIGSTSNRVTLLGNDISGNSSAKNGGGICTYDATNLQIELNWIGNGNAASSDGGGAFFSQSAGLVQSNWFVDNTTGSAGGGVSVWGGSTDLTLQGNWFEGNWAGQGGGLNIDGSAAPLVNANTFVTNTASGIGGGIYMYQAGTVTITNNILARNTGTATGGGVVIVESPARLINNTIANNTDDGVFFANAEGVAIVNNIIYGNSGDGIERDLIEPTTDYTADYNDVYNNGNPYNGLPAGVHPHDMAVDPQFVAAGPNLTAYYHIQNTSPVSTTGSISWAPERDIDGELRIAGGSVSIGADEIPDAALTVTKHADLDRVQDGSLLTYTIRITNTGDVNLTAIITDVLPAQVTTTQPLVWSSQVITAPGGVWVETVVVTVEAGCTGPLTNVVQVTTAQGAVGYAETSTTVKYYIYLPCVLRSYQ